MNGNGTEAREARRPYASPSNLTQVISRARSRNLPDFIDGDFLRVAGIGDAVHGRVLEALRFLGLIHEDGKPTDTLIAISGASDEEYRRLLRGAIGEAYADDLARGIDIAQDTQAQIVDAFRRYQPRSQTGRMVMFFLGMAREAGMEVAEAPRERSMRRTLPPNARTTRARSVPARGDKGRTSPPKPADHGFPQELAGLLNGLPDAATGWTKDRRDKFLEAFQVVLDFVIPIREVHEMEDSDVEPGGQT